MNSATIQSSDALSARTRAYYILIVAAFPAVLAGLLSLLVFASGAVQRDDGIRHTSDFAQFNYPVPGDLVNDRFELRGTIKNVPLGETIYLAELSEGRYWPKKHIGSLPTNFKRDQVASAGAGYKYSVVLLSVNVAGKSQIEDWFAHGRKTGKYPGITQLDGASLLVRLRIVHQ